MPHPPPRARADTNPIGLGRPGATGTRHKDAGLTVCFLAQHPSILQPKIQQPLLPYVEVAAILYQLSRRWALGPRHFATAFWHGTSLLGSLADYHLCCQHSIKVFTSLKRDNRLIFAMFVGR